VLDTGRLPEPRPREDRGHVEVEPPERRDDDDPITVPKALDVIPPPGVAQSTELDPTLGPVVLQGITIP
jgi:hypothetical protein